MLCVTERRNPEWAEPCAYFLRYVIQVTDLVELTQKGIQVLTQIPYAVEALIEVGDTSDKSMNEKRLKDANQRARLAESEIKNEFPLLHNHAIMGLWGALESAVEDLAVSWMQHNPAVLEEARIAKIKIPLIEFQRMTEQDRLRFIVTELQRDLGSELKAGVTRFESLLGLLGLGGPVDKRVRDVIYETQNLRNIFAHRGGVADQRFATNCPHLRYSIGDQVKIDKQYFNYILGGLLTYSLIILNRCRAIDGFDLHTGEPRGFEGALSVQRQSSAATSPQADPHSPSSAH
jgi:hypothetical protein